jgi:ribosomal protein L32
MNQLKNCPECGKIYVENPGGLCPLCRELELEAEDKVAQFMRKVSTASIDEIAAATGVKEKIILRMISRGRIVGNCQISYPCEMCGTAITTGRVCTKCSKNIAEQMKIAQAGKAGTATSALNSSVRMYTKDSSKKR